MFGWKGGRCDEMRTTKQLWWGKDGELHAEHFELVSLGHPSWRNRSGSSGESLGICLEPPGKIVIKLVMCMSLSGAGGGSDEGWVHLRVSHVEDLDHKGMGVACVEAERRERSKRKSPG